MVESCTKTSCRSAATSSLRYDYDTATAWLSALDPEHSGSGHRLCDDHADRTSVPQGWSLVDDRARTTVILSVSLPGVE